ncbi:MAG TPA: GNAT family N-acetyltransferase [Acidimicrobiia bacterium]
MPATLRPATAADLPAIHAVNRRVEIADEVPIVTPLEEFEDWLDDPHLSLEDDVRIVEMSGEPIGYGFVWHRPSDARESRAFVSGGIVPEYRRQGAGSLLLGWQLQRARDRVRTGPEELPRYIRTNAFESEAEAIALYESHGMRPIRYYDELLRPLDSVPPVPELDGISLVAWEDARREEVRQVSNLAFADHWGTSPVDAAAWNHRLDSYGTRLELSWIALNGDRVVGLSINGHFPSDQELTGRLDGWVQTLGTHPEYRRRGIASALVLRSCHTFVEAGFTHAALGVDSENPTGAYRLYQRLGFAPLHRSVSHQLEV